MTPIRQIIINAIRYGAAGRVLPEIMGVDYITRQRPSGSGIGEIADQLFLLGIDADNGKVLVGKKLDPVLRVMELGITLRVGWPSETFDVDVQGIILVAEQVCHGGRRCLMAQVSQFQDDLPQAAPRIFGGGSRIATRVL